VRNKSWKYAEGIKRPNKSIELSEVIKERKNESLERGNNGERLVQDVKKIKMIVENYKKLFAY